MAAARVIGSLRRSLAPRGLDVVIPLTVEKYNAFLDHDTTAASDITRFKLPLASDSLASHLLVLIGNSRAMWEPFLSHVATELEREGHVLPDPIDRYIKMAVETAISEIDGADTQYFTMAYWVADTTPGKMILAQKMAAAAHAVSKCPPSQICLHPVLGPWLAFRCALVFSVEGLTEPETSDKQPLFCDHDDKMHELLAAQMAEALGQIDKENPGIISPDAWKKWVLPRITIAPNHPMMYDREQILYHYTKDLSFLAKVIIAKQHKLCTDYLREPPPPAAVQFRTLFQQVLSEWQAKYPEGIDAICLSGGLDTSILAEASAQPWESEHGIGHFHLDKATDARPMLQFKHALTVQARPEAKDADYARSIFSRLDGHTIEQLHILQRSLEELLDHAQPVAKRLATCDPMELRNSLVIYATLKHAANLGVKTIVTGDGADEIFCGYSFYQRMAEDKLLAYRDQIMRVMGFTAPRLAQDFGIKVISPYLDERVIAFAKTLTKSDIIGERTPVPVDGPAVFYGKLMMRQAFPEAFSQWRSKQPIEEGSGTTALRMGYFDDRYTAEEFASEQRRVWLDHGVFIRDNEHLFFFRAFLEAFDDDLSSVPTRRLARKGAGTYTLPEDAAFCPACGFELSHIDQDFCVTCGHWPTRVTETNDASGYATKALDTLDSNLRKLANPEG